MNIKLPATLTASVTHAKFEENTNNVEWIDITLLFGKGPIKTWRLYPKDVIHNNLNYFLLEEYAEEELEQFIVSKLQELWFPQESP